MLEIVPMTLKEANAFVEQKHRHHGPVVGHKFSIGLSNGEEIVGVAIVGRPVARHLDDGWTLEVNRLCTDGSRNACSMLYAAAWRAARAMGYKRLVTYILDTENGASLRAAGWKCICNTPDTEKVIITSGAAGEVEVTMHIEFSNTGIITFIVDPYALTATKKDIQEHNAAQTAHEAKFEQKADVTDLNAHVNNSDIHVNPTTMGNYDTAISGLIEHTEDADIHVSAEEENQI